MPEVRYFYISIPANLMKKVEEARARMRLNKTQFTIVVLENYLNLERRHPKKGTNK